MFSVIGCRRTRPTRKCVLAVPGWCGPHRACRRKWLHFVSTAVSRQCATICCSRHGCTSRSGAKTVLPHEVQRAWNKNILCMVVRVGLLMFGRVLMVVLQPSCRPPPKSSRPENRKLQGASAHRIQVTQSSAWTTGKDGSRFHVHRMRGWNDIPFRACTDRRRLRVLATPGTLAAKNEKSQNASFPPDQHTHGCAWSRCARKSACHDNPMRGSSGVGREVCLTQQDLRWVADCLACAGHRCSIGDKCISATNMTYGSEVKKIWLC